MYASNSHKNSNFRRSRCYFIKSKRMSLRLDWCDPGVRRYVSCCWEFHREVVSVIDASIKQKLCHVKNWLSLKKSVIVQLSKLWSVDSFVTVVWRICQSQRYYMDMSELLHGMSMLLYVFLSDEQKQAEVWLRVWSSLIGWKHSIKLTDSMMPWEGADVQERFPCSSYTILCLGL